MSKQCEYCEKELIGCYNQKHRRFCDRSCSNAWQHANGKRRTYVNDRTTYEWWMLKFGKEIADEKHAKWLEKMSIVTSGECNPMHGRRDQIHGLRAFSTARIGKTLEEVHGHELAREIRESRSSRVLGARNPAFGKVYMNGGKSVKGRYKGHFFRSLLEYSFMKHLEKQGFSLDVDVQYECFKVPYQLEGRDRTYTIDFYVKKQNVVYEVKQAYVIRSPRDKDLVKWNAARTFFAEKGVEFRVVTEDDFQKISFNDAQIDCDVVWFEKTLTYFKQGNQ